MQFDLPAVAREKGCAIFEAGICLHSVLDRTRPSP